MVAYSFKKQHVPKIRDYTKLQTIRGHRKRHARPGESLQLYTGQRTPECEKLIPDPTCKSVHQIKIAESRHDFQISVDDEPLGCFEVQNLAIADGFESAVDFFEFFKKTHDFPFEGVLIKWHPPAIASTGQINLLTN